MNRERWIRTTISFKIIVSIALVYCCMYLIRALGRTRTYDDISTAELQSAHFAAQVTSAYMKIYIEYILMS